MSKEKRKETTLVRISDLAKACNSSDYWEVWRLFERENISKELQRMVMGKQSNKNPNWQQEYIDMIKGSIKAQEEKIAKYEQEYQKAEEQFKKALENFRNAKESLEKAKERKNAAILTNEKQKSELSRQEKKLEKMGCFVLVHPTATISALDKKVGYTVVCTKFDVESIKFKLFADRIEETLDFEELSKTDFPADAFSKFSTSKEYTSAIEYVKMVARYWVENKPFELLYHDDGIKYILDKIKLF